MVRLQDSAEEWTEHRHTTGRLFLTNPRTKETRWLWQKWDINGRLFVRNIADPSRTVWVDSMDLPMRLASGMASPAEVDQYKQHHAAPPPPPPPPHTRSLPHPQHMPYASDPAQHHLVSHAQPHVQPAPLRSQPYPPSFPHPTQAFPARPPHPQFPLHAPPGTYADTAKGFGANYPAVGQGIPPQYSGHTPQSHVEDVRRLHHEPHAQPPVNPQIHSRFGPPTSVPFDRYQPSQPPHHLHPPRPPVEPVRPDFNRDAIRPDFPHDDAYSDRSSPRVDSEQQKPSFHFRSPRNHSIPSPNFDHSANQTQKPYAKGKRFRDYSVSGAGRYWAKQDNSKPFKRFKSDKGFNGKQKQSKSRFAAALAPEDLAPEAVLPHHPPRPKPLPIEPGSVIPTCRNESFRPTSKYAKCLLKTSVDVGDTSKLAMLYNRDFKPFISENGASPCSVRGANGDEEYAFEVVVGTCEEVEKDFLRLTSAPKPSAVRPPHVLKQSLAHIKNMWREAERDYDWVCRQLKSVRQDYKVQHVEDTDVADVYETHARIALEKGDLGEFNTCVAQVQELFKKVNRSEQVQDEFASYRILYNLLVGAREWEQSKILAQFSAAERTRKATRFALHIRQAIVSGNYHNYFKMSLSPPSKTMISYLLVHFRDRVRWRAISTMVTAYSPGNIPVSFVLDHLGWTSDETSDETSDDRTGADLKRILQAKAADSDLLHAFSSLNLYSQPAITLKGLTFLLDVGAVLKFEDSKKPDIERLVLDCKSTKASGIRKYEASKLITHAGAELS